MKIKRYLMNIIFVLRILTIYMILSVGCFFMLRTVIGYMHFRDDVQFLIYKQAYIHDLLWKTAFYIHVFSAIIALFAGFTQFSRDFLTEHRAVHRFVGKIYVCIILFVNVPAALIMSLYANGGLWGKTAFLLLNTMWFVFTLKAWRSIVKGNIASHEKFMIRSYALTLSALTLRSWKIILIHSPLPLNMTEIYVLEAWLGFVPNIIVAEWIIKRKASHLANEWHRIQQKNDEQ